MQLNSLTFKHYTPPPQSKYHLPIYDHKLAVVNREIFVFGKNIQNFQIQTPLHKINLQTFNVQPVYTLNPPNFQDFIMFPFQQNIYFWGKTTNSQKNQLYQFDGCKFTKMDQNGQIPQWKGHYSHTKFSSKYVLLFNCLTQDEFKIKWYILDIKKRQWRRIISDMQIPVCQKSNLIWINGRGYLLLMSAYDKVKKQFMKNVLYEIKFKSFAKLILQMKQIPLSKVIRSQNIVFTNLITFGENELYILGGQEISLHHTQYQKRQKPNDQILDRNSFQLELLDIPCSKIQDLMTQLIEQKMEQELNLNSNKIVYKFDLELSQWLKDCEIIPIKGQHFEIVTFQHKIYVVGGTLGTQLMPIVQYYDFRSKQRYRQISYEQSLCYYCEQAFTYEQQLISQSIVEIEYEKFCPRNQIENKFIKKLSQSITTELQAIGMVCEFFVNRHCKSIFIDLCEYINPQANMKMAKRRIQNCKSEILMFRGLLSKTYDEQLLIRLFSNVSQIEKEYFHSQDHSCQDWEIQFMKLKMASFRIGLGFLYVTLTAQGSIFVGYSSYSQIQFPQLNYRSFSQNYYTIKYDKSTKSIIYSSSNQRHIIHENVKLYFGSPPEYQNLQILVSGKSKDAQKSFVNVYVIEVTNLEKKVVSFNNYAEDIQIKSLPKTNKFNSLTKYLQHLYLNQHLEFKIFLQNKFIEIINVYDQFEEFKMMGKIYEIPASEDSLLKKSQNEETHFSTNQDEIVVSWKKIDIVEKCKFYQVKMTAKLSLQQTYRNIYVYQNSKLLRAIPSKRRLLCGIVELSPNLEVELNGIQLVSKQSTKQFLKWIDQLQKSIENEHSLYKIEL